MDLNTIYYKINLCPTKTVILEILPISQSLSLDRFIIPHSVKIFVGQGIHEYQTPLESTSVKTSNDLTFITVSQVRPLYRISSSTKSSLDKCFHSRTNFL